MAKFCLSEIRQEDKVVQVVKHRFATIEVVDARMLISDRLFVVCIAGLSQLIFEHEHGGVCVDSLKLYCHILALPGLL